MKIGNFSPRRKNHKLTGEFASSAPTVYEFSVK